MDTASRALFLTWRTYGTWLPGDARGWVDDRRNGRGEPMNRPDHRLEAAAAGLMRSIPMVFTPARRIAVEDSLRATTEAKGWHLLAANVRTNHVHVILGGEDFEPDVIVVLKNQATKALRRLGLVSPDVPVWSRGGSKRALVGEKSIEAAIDYVLHRQ